MYVQVEFIFLFKIFFPLKKLRRIVQQIETNYILHFQYNIQNTYNINKKIH